MRFCECGCSLEHKIKSAKYCSDSCKNAAWQARNWDRVLATAKRYRDSHEKTEEQKAKSNKQCQIWKQKNSERRKAVDRAYHQSKQGDPEYLAKRRHHEAMRRARKLQATPKWLSKEQLEEIKAIYRNCPEGYHVDHIMPLKGKDVSGLHVPWNLQYLPGIVNKMKSNKVEYGDSN